MSTFRFRLATLLRLRLAERDQRRAELAKAQQAESLLLTQIETIDSERRELAELARQLASPGEANVDALVRTHRHDLTLKTQARQLAGQLSQVRTELERRRQILVEADRGVRVLEKLRDRQQATHRNHEDSLERRDLDEQAVLGFARQEAQP
jgi:flagellar export protein FliJ